MKLDLFIFALQLVVPLAVTAGCIFVSLRFRRRHTVRSYHIGKSQAGALLQHMSERQRDREWRKLKGRERTALEGVNRRPQPAAESPFERAPLGALSLTRPLAK